jgi:superfamily II DNA or RNA helicase
MSIRQIRQQEAVDAWMESGGRSIINACPRFGKIKTSIEVCKKVMFERLIIVYPRKDIQAGWEDDFVKWGYRPHVHFFTYRSLDKYVPKDTDFIIYDELHEASEAQLRQIAKINKDIPVLGLTGTMTWKTEEQILDLTGIDVCYRYSIDEGVEEGILCDYDIYVHHIDLNNSSLTHTTAKGKQITEKKAFDNLSFVAKKLKDQRKSFFFMDLKRISIIQESVAKRLKTLELILERPGKRILVFCGTQKLADSLGIPSYHSGNKDKDLFTRFCSGEGDLLATIKMMQAGVTITPIDLGIINYTSGNPEDTAQKICRFLGFEYNNPDKKAQIHIVCSTEKFEIDRIKTALKFFNTEKIHLLNFPHEQEEQQDSKAKEKTGIQGKKRV